MPEREYLQHEQTEDVNHAICYPPRHSWWHPNPSLVLLKGAIAENTVLIAILMRLAGGTHLDRQGPVTDGGGV